jgi:CTP synthase
VKKVKYIFVVGGVMSGVGKGVTTASIAKILKGKGFVVSPIKIDPYLNVDAGTMNPTEHGEVFVLDSGLECDQDMGNYERFLDVSLPSENYMTNGMVFKTVIDKERALGYEGKCVEPVYHITEEILRRIEASNAKMKPDICIMEIGGTVGEYQNAIFIEAARILKLRNPDDVMFVMVSYLPIPGKLGEMKTKPTQNAIRTLNSYGVHPDIIIARSEVPLDVKRKQKIAESNGVRPENVISAPDVESIYDVPVNFEKDGLSKTILDFFKLREKQTDLVDWRKMLVKHKRARGKVKIAVVGKYFKTGDFVLSDAYISVLEALKHSATYFEKKCEIAWLNSEVYEKNPAKLKELSDYDGILVPGGFGTRGVEGLIKTIEYARKNKIPYFGLCYGMQLAVIEYARNVVGVKGATTREIDPKAKNLVVDIMPEQIKNLENGAYGGTMRLGSYKAFLKKGSVAAKAYGTVSINERHRHRFEINPAYIERVESAGLVFSGRSPNGMLMEIAELPQKVHPFFVAVQFHPEFKSTPLNPHPLFREFIKAATTKKKK